MQVNLNQVSKQFGKKSILQELTCSFDTGNTYCILGKNGSGKSTLFNLIGGLKRCTKGEIVYDGVGYGAELPTSVKQRIGFYHEWATFFTDLSVFNYLHFIGKLYQVDSQTIQLRAVELLKYLFEEPEKEIMSRSMSKLSTGMRAKIVLMATLIHLPNLLVLDEPFATLDIVSANKVITLLKKYQTQERTILLSSHNLDFVEKLNPLLVVLNDAKIAFSGTITEFLGDTYKDLNESLISTFGGDSTQADLTWM